MYSHVERTNSLSAKAEFIDMALNAISFLVITLVVYVKHMKKSKWLDCQGNEFFPKQKGTPSLVKIEHKNTATLDSARSKKKI